MFTHLPPQYSISGVQVEGELSLYGAKQSITPELLPDSVELNN